MLCSLLFGATAGSAISSYGNFSRVVGSILGAIFGISGVAAMAIFSVARRPRAPRGAQTAGADVTVGPDSTYQGFGDFDLGTARGAAAMSAGFDLFEPKEIPWGNQTLLDADSPGIPVRTLRRPDWTWARSCEGRRGTVLGGASVVVSLATIAIAWVSIDASIIPKFWFYIPGTGIDVAVLITAAVVGAGVAVIANRPLRWPVIVIAWVADTWLVAILIAISARQTVAEFLDQVGALSLSVGDTLSAFGVDTTGGVVEIPPGVDLSSLGSPGRTIDLSSIELGAVIPDVSVQIGPRLYLIIAFAVLANAFVFIALVSADRRARTTGQPELRSQVS